ncbi:MAG: hypothetical protein E7332_09905 [Clostridiales bacterium]|nr:hypothetical protein [Clostridiales bacterium]
MKCPYCGNDMEKGKLHSHGGVFFLPDGESMPLLYTKNQMEKHRAVSLPPKLNSIAPKYPEAAFCRSCRKIIISCEE